MGGREGRRRLHAGGSREGARALSWELRIAGPARKDLKRLDEQTRTRVMKSVRKLAETDLGDVVKVTGLNPPEWRLRVGDWRVRFAYMNDEDILMVLRVLPRGKAYDR